MFRMASIGFGSVLMPIMTPSLPNPYEILCRVLGHDQAVTVQLLLNFGHQGRRSKTMATATPGMDQQTACPPTLCLACELGENQWKLGCTTGEGQPTSTRHASRRMSQSRSGCP